MQKLKNKILNGYLISREDAFSLIEAPLDELCDAANEIRLKMCGSGFDLCSIINAKSGKCPENCRYCAQSSHYSADADEYPLIDSKTAVRNAAKNAESGILRFSLVTSGRKLSDEEVSRACELVKDIKKNVDISVCGSFGLLSEDQFSRLREAGLDRVHNNLETSRRYFPYICTTHTYDDKIKAIKAAMNAGLSVCSGGIMGLGETMEDRIDMAIDIRELGIRSIPVNMLNPIKGTPLQHNEILSYDTMMRICAIFRFINPTASIRLSGGRGLMPDKGEQCFKSGANAAITMNMLTTSGITVSDDLHLLKKLGYKPQLMSNI